MSCKESNMKKTILLISIVLLLTVSCSRSNSKITTLSPVDSLGWQESEEFFFKYITTIENYDGKLFAGNAGSFEILVFDEESLDYLYKIGREGKGPGEFSGIYDTEIFDDKLYIADIMNSRISIFDLTGKYIRMIKSDLAFFIEGGTKTLYGTKIPSVQGSGIMVIDGDSLINIFDVHGWAAETHGLKYEDEDNERGKYNRWYNFNTIDDNLLVAMRFAPYKVLIDKSGKILNYDYEIPKVLHESERILYGKPYQYKEGFVQPITYNWDNKREISYLYYYKDNKVQRKWYLDMGEKKSLLYYNWDLTGNTAWIPMRSDDALVYKFVIE